MAKTKAQARKQVIDYSTYTVVQLKQILKERGIGQKPNKAAMIKALEDHDSGISSPTPSSSKAKGKSSPVAKSSSTAKAKGKAKGKVSSKKSTTKASSKAKTKKASSKSKAKTKPAKKKEEEVEEEVEEEELEEEEVEEELEEEEVEEELEEDEVEEEEEVEEELGEEEDELGEEEDELGEEDEEAEEEEDLEEEDEAEEAEEEEELEEEASPPKPKVAKAPPKSFAKKKPEMPAKSAPGKKFDVESDFDVVPEEEDLEETEVEEKTSPSSKAKRSFRKQKPTETKKMSAKEKEGLARGNKEGLFGTYDEVTESLTDLRTLLELYQKHSDEEFYGLCGKIFDLSDTQSLESLISTYVSPIEKCSKELKAVLKSSFPAIMAQVESALKVARDVTPRFDSNLGIYRIENFALIKSEDSSALIFASIKKDSSGKEHLTPLTKAHVKSVPSGCELYHVYYKTENPPDEDDIENIVGENIFPKYEYEGDEDGITSVPEKEDENTVEKELSAISTPPPSKDVVEKYLRVSKKLATTNYATIAKEAGISREDSLYITLNKAKLMKKYNL